MKEQAIGRDVDDALARAERPLLSIIAGHLGLSAWACHRRRLSAEGQRFVLVASVALGASSLAWALVSGVVVAPGWAAAAVGAARLVVVLLFVVIERRESRRRADAAWRELAQAQIAAFPTHREFARVALDGAGLFRRRPDDDDFGASAGVPVPDAPPPGKSERGPRQRGPRAWAEAE